MNPSWRLLCFPALMLLCASGTLAAQDLDAPDVYPFPIGWTQSAPAPISLQNRTLQAPAGARGAVRAEGGRMVFSDGSDARFWGVTVEPRADLMGASREDLSALAHKLASFGINHVRFVRIDGPRTGLFESWSRTGSIDKDWLAAFDWFVAKLREAGIYYTLALNHSSRKYEDVVRLAPNARGVKHKRFNGVQLFDESAIEMAIAWTRAFLDHRNPHTGLRFADDPANIHFSAVGEDSIFNLYFRNWSWLGEENIETLQRRFNAALLKSHGTRAALEKAWQQSGVTGLRKGEDPVKGTVEFVPAKRVDRFSRERVRSQMRYLYSIDENFARRMHSAVRGSGYDGLYVYTDNWFGYANALAAAQTGGYVEGHAFFDHPGKHQLENGRAETVLHTRHLSMAGTRRMPMAFNRNLFRLFNSAIADRPMVVSEWNHSGWSRHAYEGPLLMTAYAGLHGWDTLDLHVLMSRRIPLSSTHSAHAFALSGNSVQWALMPSLALAHVRGDIEEARETLFVATPRDADGWMDLSAATGIARQLGDGTVPLEAGFQHKIAMRLPGDLPEAKEKAVTYKATDGEYRSDTGQILWDYRDAKEPLFTVKAPRFAAAAGTVLDADLGFARASLGSDAALTAVSLDGEPLRRSSSILISMAGSYQNTGRRLISEYNNAGRVRYQYLLDAGRGPPLLERVRGSLSLRTRCGRILEATALFPDGSKEPLAAVRTEQRDGVEVQDFHLGDADTPWYLLTFRSPDE